METIRERYESVLERIAASARRAGRSPEEIRVVAVSKTQPPERMVEAIEAGVEILGENRVQEAQGKCADMDPEIARRVRWHLVGSLQRNKARIVPGLFDAVESLDSVGLAQELARRVQKADTGPLDVFVQVNTGEEPQKGGVAPGEAMELVRAVAPLESLRTVGLMCVPPLGRDPEESRPHFQLLRRLREEAQAEGFDSVRELSMGMSADFELAVAEGATYVRVGTAIFGPRPAP